MYDDAVARPSFLLLVYTNFMFKLNEEMIVQLEVLASHTPLQLFLKKNLQTQSILILHQLTYFKLWAGHRCWVSLVPIVLIILLSSLQRTDHCHRSLEDGHGLKVIRYGHPCFARWARGWLGGNTGWLASSAAAVQTFKSSNWPRCLRDLINNQYI